MNKRLLRGLYACMFFCSIVARCLAFDLIVPYQTAGFQANLSDSAPVDWRTKFLVSYRHASARKAWNASSKRKELFDGDGPFDISALGVGVTKRTPLTEKYWKDHTLFSVAGKPTKDFGGTCMLSKQGQLVFTGVYKNDQVDLMLRQDVKEGFFAHIFLPIKHVSLKKIKFTYLGDDADVKNFLDNELTTLLKEHDLQPVTTCYKKTGIGDLLCSVGWTGATDQDLGIISWLSGTFMAGMLFPIGTREDVNRVFTLPLGYHGDWGFNARIQVDASLWKYLIVGASLGSTVFMRRTTTMRVKTDKRQNGWLMLEKTRVRRDQGSIWDLEAYVGGRYSGLTALAGFSFARQEALKLHARDGCLLNAIRQKALDTNSQLVNSDNVINADKRLRGWEQYVLHILVEYDLQQALSQAYAPIIAFHYDYQMVSKNTFDANPLGFTVGLSCRWNCF